MAVRFLGGVSNYTTATDSACVDSIRRHVWCDLAVRDHNSKHFKLTYRFDVIPGRLDRYVQAGMDLVLVLDNVPYAFVSNHSQPCQNYGCQYLPPNNATAFSLFISEMAKYLVARYGMDYAARIQWRLGTEANGPRWGGRGRYFEQYWLNYKLTMQAIRNVISTAKVGGSNWVEVTGKSGNLTRNGTDAFQYQFYSNINKDASVPLDFISISHYGSGRTAASPQTGLTNFPFPDFVQRTPSSENAQHQMELTAMQALANRPSASLQVQEWSILKNELSKPTFEPSSLGAAWATASATTWMCHGADRIFHWETGSQLKNSSGDQRMVNFYEQWPWSMGLLEMFLGGSHATFQTFRRAANTMKQNIYGVDIVTVLESQQVEKQQYLMMAAAVAGQGRTGTWTTKVTVSTNMFQQVISDSRKRGLNWKVKVQQWVMNTNNSVTEEVLRDLKGRPGMFQQNDGLPYRFDKMLTRQGMEYVESGENLNRYWKMHADSFQPQQFEGAWSVTNESEVVLHFNVTPPSVLVLSCKLER